MPGLRRERACQARCRDPAASALTINRGDGVDSGRRRTATFARLNRCQHQVDKHWYGRAQIPAASPFAEEDDVARPRTALAILMESPVAARWRNRKGGLVINN